MQMSAQRMHVLRGLPSVIVPNPITDGSPAAITYSTNDTQTPVTITLRQGNSNNLQTVQVLTNDSNNGQFVWNPPKSIPNGVDYALQIDVGCTKYSIEIDE